MITIDFSSAIAIYLCFSIFLVFLLWIFYNYRKDGISIETKYLQQCPYCTYIFFNHGSQTAEPTRAKGEDERPETTKDPMAQDQESESGYARQKGRILICPRCQSYINLPESEQSMET